MYYYRGFQYNSSSFSNLISHNLCEYGVPVYSDNEKV